MELDLTGIHKLAAEQGIDPETLDDALAEALRLATSRPRTPPSTRAWSLTNVPATSPCGRRRNPGRTHRRQPLPRSQAGRGIRRHPA